MRIENEWRVLGVSVGVCIPMREIQCGCVRENSVGQELKKNLNFV